jgi:hypothetical protein
MIPEDIKPIIMHCTQKDYDSIREILLNNGLKEESVTNFSRWPYLTNNYFGTKGDIANVHIKSATNEKYNRTLFEEWNANIFLEYCGIIQSITNNLFPIY